MLTIRDVATRLKISPATVYGWVSSGALAVYRLGAKERGAIRIAEADLLAFLDKRKRGGQQEALPAAPKPGQPKSSFRHIHVR